MLQTRDIALFIKRILKSLSSDKMYVYRIQNVFKFTHGNLHVVRNIVHLTSKTVVAEVFFYLFKYYVLEYILLKMS